MKKKKSFLTKTLGVVESVAFLANARKWSRDIDTLGFIFGTNIFLLALIYVGASQSVAHVAQVAHALVSSRWMVAKATTVAGRVAQHTWWYTGFIEGHCAVQTWADVSPGGVDALWEGRASGIWEGALIHIHTGEAVAFKTLLTSAKVVSNEVCAKGPRVAGTRSGALIDILTLGAVCWKSSIAGASVGPDGVETRGVDVARVVFTLVHVDAVHVFGRAVVTNSAGALKWPIGVLALFVYSAGVVHFFALVYILTKSPIDQNETRVTQAREGTLVVEACSFVSATPVIDKTLVYITALDCPISRISRLAGAVVGAGEIDTKGLWVTLRDEGALIHVRAGKTISPISRRTLAGEGAGWICADRVGAAAACRAFVQVMALGVIKDEAAATVAVKWPPGIDTGGGGRADVGCRTLVDVLTLSAVSYKSSQTGALIASQPVDTNGIWVALIDCAAFIDVRTCQAIPYETGVAGAAVRAHGVLTVRVQTTDVARAFIDVHAALSVAFEATAARTAVAARQIFTASVAKRGRTHTRSFGAFVYVQTQVVTIAFVAGIACAYIGPRIVGAGGVPVADSFVRAFVDISAQEAIAAEANLTLALSPTLIVGAEGISVAPAIFFLAFINVPAVGAISHVSTEADTAVAAQGVVAASFRVAAVQLT